MARGDRISKGVEANRLLNDPALIEAFEDTETEIINALATIPLDGSPDTNALVVEKVRDLQANRRLRRTLIATRDHGNYEAKRLEMAETQQKRVKRDPRWSE